MRNTGGFTSVCLSKNSRIPIYKQLGDALLTLIENGVLESDSRLPPIRKMAESLRINSSTVVNAYKYLETKNAVYSFSGSGTFVAPIKVKDMFEGFRPGAPVSDISAKESSKKSADNTAGKRFIDFTSVNISEHLFPKTEIKKAFSSLADELGSSLFSGISQSSIKPLSEIMAARLKKDGIAAKDNNLVITDSALEAAASAVVKKGDTVIVEKPAAYSKIGVFSERGANVVQACLCREGIEPDGFEALLKTYRPKAALLSTYFQSPTGICCSLQNKRTILELCYKYGAYIIEEDSYSDLTSGVKKVFLKSIDYKDRVIYVKSVTKYSTPYFNVSVCVFPERLAKNAEKSRCSIKGTSNGVQIRILSELIKNGIYDEHTKKIVKIDELLRNKTAENIDKKLKDFVEYDENETGLFFWLKLKKGGALEFAEKCAQKGVLLSPEEVFCSNTNTHVRLCPRSAAEYDAERITEKIARGIDIMREVFETL